MTETMSYPTGSQVWDTGPALFFAVANRRRMLGFVVIMIGLVIVGFLLFSNRRKR